MRKLFLLSIAGGLLACTGCAKSIEDEARDVRDAQQEAREEITDEARDVREEQAEGAAEIRKEQRELDQAVDDARNDGDPSTP